MYKVILIIKKFKANVNSCRYIDILLGQKVARYLAKFLIVAPHIMTDVIQLHTYVNLNL